MKVVAARTRLFLEGDNLATFVREHIRRLPEGAILAVASKVVALSEGRVANSPGKAAKERLILTESDRVLLDHSPWWLTVRDGTIVVNAGIDDSNARGKLILLPEDSFASAARLRRDLKKLYGVKRLGVVVTDSRITPLRAGVVGVALGYAGFKGVRDYRGRRDLFGRLLKVTQTNIADSLATAACLVMGEGKERQPLAVIEEAPVEWRERADRRELSIGLREDLYGPLFARAARKKRKWKK